MVLVDDEAEVAEVVGDELRASRVLVRSASNPKEAVALVREHSEAGERVVVITDLRMPTRPAAASTVASSWFDD